MKTVLVVIKNMVQSNKKKHLSNPFNLIIHKLPYFNKKAYKTQYCYKITKMLFIKTPSVSNKLDMLLLLYLNFKTMFNLIKLISIIKIQMLTKS